MEYTIDFSLKDPGYREAFEAYIGRVKSHGVFFEYGVPRLTNDRQGIQRLFQVDDNKVCARSTDIRLEGDKAIIAVEPFGPYASIFEECKSELSIAARMIRPVQPESKFINQIASLDLAMINRKPTEYIVEIPE